jgi:hypothetical protein
MASNAQESVLPPWLDELLPAMIPRTPVRHTVLLRRAAQHYKDIDQIIRSTVPPGSRGNITSLLGEHAQLAHDRKFRIQMALYELEQYVRAHPDTIIKDNVNVLQRVFEFLEQILGDSPPYSKSS